MAEDTLTTREKHQLLAVLREMDPKAPTEKRQLPRRSVVIRIRIREIKASKLQKLQWAVLQDVAAKGLGLRTSDRMNKGTRFLARLRFRESGGWLALCEVRNCAKWQDGEFSVGARLLEQIDDPDGDAKPPLDWLL